MRQTLLSTLTMKMERKCNLKIQILTNGTSVALPNKAALARGDVTLSWWRDTQTTIQADDVSARTVCLTGWCYMYKQYRKHRCRVIYPETRFKNVIIMKRTSVRTAVNETYERTYCCKSYIRAYSTLWFFLCGQKYWLCHNFYFTLNMSEVKIQKTI